MSALRAVEKGQSVASKVGAVLVLAVFIGVILAVIYALGETI